MKTEIVKVDPYFPDIKDITRCAQIIQRGGLVVFPTETVYGIAADFSNPDAMERLRQVKKRSADKPFSLLISQAELISNYTADLNPSIYKLIYAFWPGPLTIVVKGKKEGCSLGVRMPDNTIALKIVQEARCPIAASSANMEGNSPPVSCEEALRDLDGLVEMVMDGGSSAIGKSSSVVDLSGETISVLREGSITQSDIMQASNKKIVLFICTGNSCRSVMGEYLLKKRLQERSNIAVYSAGTGVFINSTASAETISVLKERGIDASRHLSRPINSLLLKQTDIIFAMTRSHRRQILERIPEVEQRVYLVKEFSEQSNGAEHDLDIPDPMGGSRQIYQECLWTINQSIEKIATLLIP